VNHPWRYIDRELKTRLIVVVAADQFTPYPVRSGFDHKGCKGKVTQPVQIVTTP
jgi:hypothetical protein